MDTTTQSPDMPATYVVYKLRLRGVHNIDQIKGLYPYSMAEVYINTDSDAEAIELAQDIIAQTYEPGRDFLRNASVTRLEYCTSSWEIIGGERLWEKSGVIEGRFYPTHLAPVGESWDPGLGPFPNA